MATASPAKRSAAAKPAAKQSAQEIEAGAVSRREFLYYIWGASIVLIGGQITAGLIWFAMPRFKEGEFGGVFKFAPEELPNAGDAPVTVPAGRFHVSHPEDGLVVLYQVCTHLGCLPKWDPVNGRFSCPCHGSQFQLGGSYITGPAPRGLDRFPLTITLANGETRTNADTGGPIPVSDIALDEIVDIAVDTGARINGPGQGETL